jgi:hypothetical protein
LCLLPQDRIEHHRPSPFLERSTKIHRHSAAAHIFRRDHSPLAAAATASATSQSTAAAAGQMGSNSGRPDAKSI